MTPEYTKWYEWGGNCDPPFGTGATLAKCAYNAFIIFVTENRDGLIVDWTRPYPACNYARNVTAETKAKAVEQFIVEFTGQWNYQQGVWVNQYAHPGIRRKYGKCYFKFCINGVGQLLPEYVTKDIICRQGGGVISQTIIKLYSFVYFGMMKKKLKCLVAV